MDPKQIPIANSADVEDRHGYAKNLYLFAFGAYADEKVYVWADSMEQGLQEAVDWLKETHPDSSTFVTGQELMELVDEARREFPPNAPEHEIEEAALADITVTGGGDYIVSYEWFVDDVYDEAEYAEVLDRSTGQDAYPYVGANMKKTAYQDDNQVWLVLLESDSLPHPKDMEGPIGGHLGDFIVENVDMLEGNLMELSGLFRSRRDWEMEEIPEVIEEIIYEAAYELRDGRDNLSVSATPYARYASTKKKTAIPAEMGPSDHLSDFKSYLNGTVIVAGEGDITLYDNSLADPVNIAIVHDGSGYTPAAAICVSQWDSEESCLQAAYEILEMFHYEHYSDHYDELVKEYGQEKVDDYGMFTETFDGKAWTGLNAKGVAEAVEADKYASKYIDIEWETNEDESDDYVPEGYKRDNY